MRPVSCILVDSGATKAQWVCLHNGKEESGGAFPGLHPYLTPATIWRESLAQLPRSSSDGSWIGDVFFYGTGCGSEQGREQVRAYFQEFYRSGLSLQVESDLLAAARAVCGCKPGLVAILGTGSNVARYDGRELAAQFGGFGYVLGDEGSGAALGKAFLRAYLYGQLPEELSRQLEDQYALSRSAIIDAVYKGALPSRYLAGWTREMMRWSHLPEVSGLIRGVFREFVAVNVKPLTGTGFQTLHCAGSVAEHFKPWLGAALRTEGLQLGQVMARPMPGLVAFHAKAGG
jgi:N-acetylglucosamine kinase-like BadF-type ATPase